MERRKIQQGVEAGKQEEERYGIYESKFSDPETKKTKKLLLLLFLILSDEHHATFSNFSIFFFSDKGRNGSEGEPKGKKKNLRRE